MFQKGKKKLLELTNQLQITKDFQHISCHERRLLIQDLRLLWWWRFKSWSSGLWCGM